MSDHTRRSPTSAFQPCTSFANRRTLTLLPPEVLSHVISYLVPKDAIMFSYTCKVAHAIPIDPALHTVVLDRSPEQIQQFRNYLLATNARPTFLKSLSLAKGVTWEIDSQSTETAAALADILQSAQNLRSFSCHGFSEGLFEASAGRIFDALTSLKDIRELNLHGASRNAADAVFGLKYTTMRKISIYFVGAYRLSVDQLFVPLARYKALEELRLSINTFCLLPTFVSGVLLPSVHTLFVENAVFPVGLAAALFPNLVRVTYRSRRYQRTADSDTHGFDNEVTRGAHWSHPLAEAHIDVLDLDIWPLSSRIRWLDFDLLRSGYSADALSAVAATKPRVLSCGYRINSDNLFWVNLPTIATDLRFLDTKVIELSGNRKCYMLIHLARFQALTVVNLCIRAYYEPEDREAELASIAHDLAVRNRQLRVIGISLVDGRYMRDDEPIWNEERLGSRWWAVEREQAVADEDSVDLWPVELLGVRISPIPTTAGLNIREYMYEADYDSPAALDRLSELTGTST